MTKIPDEIAAIVWSCPRGKYQSALLDGSEAWSGRTLRGKAKKWSLQYSYSRHGLLRRLHRKLKDHGWTVRSHLGMTPSCIRPNHRLVLVSKTETIDWLTGAALLPHYEVIMEVSTKSWPKRYYGKKGKQKAIAWAQELSDIYSGFRVDVFECAGEVEPKKLVYPITDAEDFITRIIQEET